MAALSRSRPIGATQIDMIDAWPDATGKPKTSPGARFRSAAFNLSREGGRLRLDESQIGEHALRATAAANALDHQADIAKVREWLGHANIATTRIYDHRRTRPEDSPTFKVNY